MDEKSLILADNMSRKSFLTTEKCFLTFDCKVWNIHLFLSSKSFNLFPVSVSKIRKVTANIYQINKITLLYLALSDRKTVRFTGIKIKRITTYGGNGHQPLRNSHNIWLLFCKLQKSGLSFLDGILYCEKENGYCIGTGFRHFIHSFEL